MATGRLPDPNTAPVTAKGDLYTYSTVPAKLAVGNNGETLVADSSATTGLRWQGNFAAGKNKIINGDFGIWQRGTSFSNPNSVYTADRFSVGNSTAVPTSTASQQTFTPGTAPVSGYEGSFFFRLAVTNQGSSTGQQIITRLEDVRIFANQTVTFSFWAKADASRTLGDVKIGQNFGSGGSSAVETTVTLNSTALTTSWTRYSGTVTLPSISGKTVGTSSYLYIYITPPTTTYTLDTWGWQLEAGSVATAFQTATGTLAGELAACQRYYQKTFALATAPGDNVSSLGMVYFTRQATSGNVEPTAFVRLAPSMRTAPTITLYNPYTATAGQWSDGTTNSANARAFNAVESSLIIDNTDVTINVQNAGIQYVASAEL